MTMGDIKGVLQVADEVHPDLPESEDVCIERMNLFPEGCLVFVQNDQIGGYAISHPILHCQPPELDSLLGDIAADADQFYIHDLAILPRFRSQGLAAKCIDKLLTLAVAKGYTTTCLVSVYGTPSFWGRFGFLAEPVDEILSRKLRNYGPDATFMSRKN
jgi:GNAT superfamily N-acetyltransferase